MPITVHNQLFGGQMSEPGPSDRIDRHDLHNGLDSPPIAPTGSIHKEPGTLYVHEVVLEASVSQLPRSTPVLISVQHHDRPHEALKSKPSGHDVRLSDDLNL